MLGVCVCICIVYNCTYFPKYLVYSHLSALEIKAEWEKKSAQTAKKQFENKNHVWLRETDDECAREWERESERRNVFEYMVSVCVECSCEISPDAIWYVVLKRGFIDGLAFSFQPTENYDQIMPHQNSVQKRTVLL